MFVPTLVDFAVESILSPAKKTGRHTRLRIPRPLLENGGWSPGDGKVGMSLWEWRKCCYIPFPIGSMYAIYGNIYHQYTPNVSIYTIHGSYGIGISWLDSWSFRKIQWQAIFYHIFISKSRKYGRADMWCFLVASRYVRNVFHSSC